MFRYTRSIIHLLLICVLVSASHNYADERTFNAALKPNRATKMDGEVSGYNFPAFFVSRQVQQVIELKVDKFKNYEGEVEDYLNEDLTPWYIDILVLTKQDLEIINLDKDVRREIELPHGSDLSYWSVIISRTDITVNPDIEQYSLDEVLAKNLNQSLISSFTLSPENLTGQHPLGTPGNYCIIADFHCPKENMIAYVYVTFRDSHGELSRDDYKYMHIYFAIGLIYMISSFLYSYYVSFWSLYRNKSFSVIIGPKHKLKNGEAQVWILMYMFGTSLYYFLEASRLYKLNMHDPYKPSFLAGFLRIASRILANVLSSWTLYNLMLMSLGFTFSSGLPNRLFSIQTIRQSFSSFSAAATFYKMSPGDDNPTLLETILRLASMILAATFFFNGLYDLLLASSGSPVSSDSTNQQFFRFIRWATIGNVIIGSVSAFFPTYDENGREVVGSVFVTGRSWVLFICCLYYSVKTFSELCLHGRKSVAIRFIATAILILMPLAFDVFKSIFDIPIPSGLWRMIEESRTIKSIIFSMYAMLAAVKRSVFIRHILHLVATLFVALLWKDAILEPGKVIKEE
ncbi:unnamed protein product [Kuraishia capsulata CBS 1993]|uniref:Intimal thickness related receptor IRP domain-containing protein n=1 Tax=Kuraishia capsulata CBS 1993 TaxID=1382522 RepID=W6MS48_9ASCO|nr:uncharacterized protein KUCA_T00004012001 [Kuraishia capsulata CBS 1993]CDK28032.1 unnamed protein product [Kuraishia capsulata CBS 1993]